MVIKYSRLSTSELLEHDLVKRAKNHIPVRFLKQQIVLVSIVIASFVLYIFTPLFTVDVDDQSAQEASNDINYGVIVDCGSSGTRAHIFRWEGDPLVNPIQLLRDRSNGRPIEKHITPGLSSFKDDPEKASDYMEPVMDFINDFVPSDKHLDTPVYFLATAGLRLLEPDTQKKILNDITRDLRIKYDFPKLKSQIISGAMEGAYSWLSLNINRKIYGTDSEPMSYGMIEMGGASIQVTFELKPEVENAIFKELVDSESIAAFKDGQKTLYLGEKEPVKLFATTFLGLGVNSAREALIDLLVQKYLTGIGGLSANETDISTYEIEIHDPCLAKGSKEVVHRPQVLLHASSNRNQSIGFVSHKGEKTFKINLEGSGDFLSCKTHLDRILDIVKRERLNCVPQKPCSVALLGTDFIPYKQYPFIGLSEFFFTTNEMMNLAGLFNRSAILRETNDICSAHYDELMKRFSNSGITQENRILYECFKASWMLSILHKGFKLPTRYNNFMTASSLDGQEVDWTLGAILNEVALKPVNRGKVE